MKCDMKIERSLDGYINIFIITPKGTQILVNPVAKKEWKGKLLYKLTKEYQEDEKQEKESKKNKKEQSK